MTEPITGRVSSSVGYVAQVLIEGLSEWRDFPATYDTPEEALARCQRYTECYNVDRTRAVRREITDTVIAPARTPSEDSA